MRALKSTSKWLCFGLGLLVSLTAVFIVNPVSFQQAPPFESSSEIKTPHGSTEVGITSPTHTIQNLGQGFSTKNTVPFEGEIWHTPATLSSRTLVSNKYGQFQVHSVLIEKGTIAQDWLWTNDRDQVHVVVSIR